MRATGCPRPVMIAAPRSGIYLPRMGRRWEFRGWAIVWAVLQFAFPAAAAVADATLERDAPGSIAHVEASTGEGCRPVHDAQCGLCQSLVRAQVPPDEAPTRLVGRRVAAQVVTEDGPYTSAAPPGAAPARAPPAA